VSLRKPRQPPSPTVDAIEESALRYLARSDRTEAQVKGYLARIGASAARIRTIIRRFHERGYLNDAGYARRWARDRLARKPMGRDRLEAELLAKGMTLVIVAETLDELYGDGQEQALAAALARQPAVTSSVLRRRGFQEDIIESVLGNTGREESVGSEPSAVRQRRRPGVDSV
jgi:SOS response regulatory protein OraA/RecX